MFYYKVVSVTWVTWKWSVLWIVVKWFNWGFHTLLTVRYVIRVGFLSCNSLPRKCNCRGYSFGSCLQREIVFSCLGHVVQYPPFIFKVFKKYSFVLRKNNLLDWINVNGLFRSSVSKSFLCSRICISDNSRVWYCLCTFGTSGLGPSYSHCGPPDQQLWWPENLDAECLAPPH